MVDEASDPPRHNWEHAYYPAIALWLQIERGLDRTLIDHRSGTFFSSDVVAWKRKSLPGGPVTAVEVKGHHRRLPIGSAGYGSIGQALAIRKLADLSYLAWPVPAPSLDADGRAPLLMKLDREDFALAQRLKITDHPELTAEEFRAAVRSVFVAFFEDTGVGLLTVETQVRLWAPSKLKRNDTYEIVGYSPAAPDHAEAVSPVLITPDGREHAVPNTGQPGRRVELRIREELPSKPVMQVDHDLRAWWLKGCDGDDEF